MFEHVPNAPADAIFGLKAAFALDPRPDKIDLTAGVYVDETGSTPIFAAVKEAERRIVESERTKAYLPIAGDPDFGRHVRRLLFGEGSELLDGGRAVTAHSAGGTAALRVVGDTLRRIGDGPRIWLTEPTWANHVPLFGSTGLELRTFPYFDPRRKALDVEGLLEAWQDLTPGDAVVLHGCCHNPTGVDPTPEQWRRLAGRLREAGALALIDLAYQGFVTSVDDDTSGVRALAEELDELIVCSSFSKNFGLYNERVGALTVVAATPEVATAMASQVERSVRTLYSNPPAHGAAIVRTVLEEDELRASWEDELDRMRGRIRDVRRLLARALSECGAPGDYSFMERQRGMFSFIGLAPEQVDRLREEHGVYMMRSGRMNVAGVTSGNIERLCAAVRAVSRA